MIDPVARDALATAGAIAASFLEVGPDELAVVRKAVSTAVVALALTTVEHDPEFSARWKAAGTDWVDQGEVLRDAILFVITPESLAGRSDA